MSSVEIAAAGGLGVSSIYLLANFAKVPRSSGEFGSASGAMKGAVVYAAVIGGGTVLNYALKALTGSDPLGRTLLMLKQFSKQEGGLTASSDVNSGIDAYNKLHEADSADGRNTAYKELVNAYYDLATLFYEWGWGTSFHFAYRRRDESFIQSIKRHEYYLGGRLGVNQGDEVLDVGCGIGGPMRNIAKFTGANVTGITLNPYQVDRGNELSRQAGLQELDAQGKPKGQCKSVQGDFMEMPFGDETFDGAYAIEATCHAPDRVGIYSQILRVLKPGGIFACYEWCMTDKYDPSNEEHRVLKKQIEEGDGLPDIISTGDCVKSLIESGFEVLDYRDLAEDDFGAGGKPWMLPLTPSWNPFTQRFQFTGLGQVLVSTMLRVLEFLYLAPKGTCKVQSMLLSGGIGLEAGGRTKTFTPMFLMVGRKPLKK